jgi:hypothetical protein
MSGSNKDGVPTDTVHVDTGASLDVVEMDVAVLGDEEHHTMFLADLQRTHNILPSVSTA